MEKILYNTIDRIKEVIDYKKLSVRKFSSSIGISHSLIGKIKSIGSGSRCDLILYKDQGHAFFAKKPIKYFIDTTHEIDKFLISLGYLSGESTINDQYFKLNKNN